MADISIREHEQGIKLKEDDIRVFDRADDLLQNAHSAFIKGKETVEAPYQEILNKPEEYLTEKMKETRETVTGAAEKGIRDALRGDEDLYKSAGDRSAPAKITQEPDLSPVHGDFVLRETKTARSEEYEDIDRRNVRFSEKAENPKGTNATPAEARDPVPAGSKNRSGDIHAVSSGGKTSRPYQPKEMSRSNYSGQTPGANNPAPQGQDSGLSDVPAIKTREPASIKEYRYSIKQADRGIRTSEAAGKTIKTEKAVAAEEKTRRTAQTAGTAARASAAQSAKTTAATQAGAAAAETAGESAAAGGWIVWVIIAGVILVMIIAANIAGSYLTGQMDEESRPIHEAIADINREYNERLLVLRSERDYDTVTMTGTRARWSDVLAVYFARTMDDPEDESPLGFYYITESGEERLRDIFRDMTDIDSDETRHRVREWERTEDEDGNVAYEPHWVTEWELTITVSSKTAYEMSEQLLYMTSSQRELLQEFLSGDYDELWPRLVYGYYPEDCPMIAVALQEIGNIGGEKYWRWYGFSSHVDWCACFVSWCADECGYIEQGIIPKYSSCAAGVSWFQEHGRWAGPEEEPAPSMIIFFDWDHPDGQSGPQDGHADHTGIVEKVEDGIIYTIEGNAWDVCMQNRYPVGWYEILGYGINDITVGD